MYPNSTRRSEDKDHLRGHVRELFRHQTTRPRELVKVQLQRAQRLGTMLSVSAFLQFLAQMIT